MIMHEQQVSHLNIHHSPDNSNQPNKIPHVSNQEKTELSKTEMPQALDIAIAIPFSNGEFALIDKIDHDLSYMSWHVSSTKKYAQHKITEKSGKRKYTFLHRIIGERMLSRPLTRDDFIEHKNGNKLDNRRENLSPITRSEAVQRSKTSLSNTSGYKGVNYNKNRNKWQARIKFHGQTKSLGYYHTPEEAAKAYNKAATELYGENARLNILSDKGNDNSLSNKRQD